LFYAGLNTGSDVRQEASNFRMVVLSIAPTLYITEAEEWIASKASLLNLRLTAIANLHPIQSTLSPDQARPMRVQGARLSLVTFIWA
jgi:hypothetical protein